MSIQTLREELKDMPGAERMVMRYGVGDRQIFCIDDIEVEVGPTATAEEIRAAFQQARAPAPVKKAVRKTVKKVAKKAAKKAPKRKTAKKRKK